IFVRGDVIEVPFPGETADDGKKTAVVVSPMDLQRTHGLLWVVPVTKQEEPGRHGDLPILDSAVAGVAPGSVIRTACLATVPSESARRDGSRGRCSAARSDRSSGRSAGSERSSGPAVARRPSRCAPAARPARRAVISLRVGLSGAPYNRRMKKTLHLVAGARPNF